VLCTGVYAQNIAPSHTPLSSGNSLKLHTYLDSANAHGLYSYKWQVYLDSALQIEPHNASYWHLKAMPLFKMKKYQIGEPYLDSAVKYNRKDYLDYRAFMKCIFSKDYRGAIEDFNAAREMMGNFGVMEHTYDFYTGLCYLQLNDLDSAEYLMAKDIAGQRASAGDKWVHFLNWLYMGVIQYEKENYTAALTSFDNCLKAYPHFADAEYRKANILLRQHKKDDALALMLQAETDLKKGLSFTDDNAIYELYPYQISRYSIRTTIEYLQDTATSSK